MADKDFDIQQFPTSESAKRMMGRITPIYNESFVGKWLFEVMGLEMDEARAIVDSLKKQCLITQCTWGMRYWEERYGIEVDESKDLEIRRAAVMAKLAKKYPLPPVSLERVLEKMTGREVTIIEDNPHYKFKVTIEEGPSKIDYIALINKIDTMKPSHLSYSFEIPHRKTTKLFFGVALHIEENIEFTGYDERGISGMIWLVDEEGNTLMDEEGNILIND